MDMIRKGIGGGLVTAAIVWLPRRGDALPGILPLSPAFALIALLIVGAKGDGAGFCRAWHLLGPALGLTTIAIP
jgi:membrane protein GlpM